MSEEQVDVVDGEDRVVGVATRAEVRARNLLHRTVAILCRNGAGNVYVHRRTTTKDVYPGMYDMFAGGVVASGERYDDAARRELAEELGVDGVPLEPVGRHLFLGPLERAWIRVYECRWDGAIRWQPEEVEWGDWMPLPVLEARLTEWRFPPDSLEVFDLWRRTKGDA